MGTAGVLEVKRMSGGSQKGCPGELRPDQGGSESSQPVVEAGPQPGAGGAGSTTVWM